MVMRNSRKEEKININTNYRILTSGNLYRNTAQKKLQVSSEGSQNLFKAEEGAENISEISNEQIKYLREKYDLEDLNFNYNKPGNEAAMRKYNPASENLMKELWQMGFISQKEYDAYLKPTLWAIKPLNYDSLPEEMFQVSIFLRHFVLWRFSRIEKQSFL